jgi:hypothetical protein
VWGLVLAWGLLLHQPTASAPPDRCVCETAREAGGWCAVHAVGYLGGVEISSASLYEVLDPHGHDVDLTTFPCPVCQRAIASDGFCGEHRVGFVGGKAYFSLLTHHLTKGEVRHASEIRCRRCRRNARGHGWCEAHRVGMVGSVALSDRREFEEAVHAAGVLRAASRRAARCDWCAAAMVTDTQCPVCLIRYKDGRPVR